MTLTNTTAGDSFQVYDVASDTTPFVINQYGNVGVGESSPVAKLQVETNTSELTGRSALIVNQAEGEDIFSASASGTTRLTLDNSGNLSLYNQGDFRAYDLM